MAVCPKASSQTVRFSREGAGSPSIQHQFIKHLLYASGRTGASAEAASVSPSRARGLPELTAPPSSHCGLCGQRKQPTHRPAEHFLSTYCRPGPSPGARETAGDIPGHGDGRRATRGQPGTRTQPGRVSGVKEGAALSLGEHQGSGCEGHGFQSLPVPPWASHLPSVQWS